MGRTLSRKAAAGDFTTGEFLSGKGIGGEAASPASAEKDKPPVVAATKTAVAKHMKALDAAFTSIKKAFFTIGFNLYWLNDTGAFAEAGGKSYDTINDFAKDRYGLGRSTTYAYLSVVRRFGKMNEKTGEIDAIKDAYAGYSSTALIIMSGMTDEQLLRCNSGMKTAQLRAIAADADLLPDNDAPGGNADGKADRKAEAAPKPFAPPKTPNAVELYDIVSADDFKAREHEIMEGIKKTLLQDNGIAYHVSIVMTW